MVPAARTIQYGYAQTGWKDLMTSYNGQSITYDEIGNPLTYRDGMTMTWTGRQLTTLTQNGKQNTYKYDVDGLRLEKTAGGVTTQYQYVNGQLLGEKRSDGVILRYTYDALGVLSGIQYKNAAGVTTNYIVRCTLSGDVDQIYNTKGNLLARYIYDTWGSTLSVTDASGKAITDPLHIANINPIRYRGYYYDAETGLYYLQSRYYDTTTRRFLNADEILGMNAGAAYNLFAYCGNNPMNMQDDSGRYPVEVNEKSYERKMQNITQWYVSKKQYDKARYSAEKRANKIMRKYGMKGDEQVCRLTFSENTAQVTNSYRVISDKDKRKVCEILLDCGFSNLPVDQANDYYYSEWKWHNIAYDATYVTPLVAIGIAPVVTVYLAPLMIIGLWRVQESAISVDFEKGKDSRFGDFFVNVPPPFSWN